MDDIEYYCSAPFVHIAIDNSGTDTYRPCCLWQGLSQAPDASAMAAFASQDMADLRKHMLSGLPHQGCNICHSHEAASGDSLRLGFNRQYGMVNTADLQDIEFNLGNLCNMRCRMCSSVSSSRWIADDEVLGRTSTKLTRRKLAQLGVDIKRLKKIKFIGGEITLEQDEVRHVLSSIANSCNGLNHLAVEIITNGMLRLDDDIMQMLLSCRSVDMVLSLDGMSTANDYQRSEGNWAVITDTARYYDGLRGAVFNPGIISTISMLTIADAVDLMEWVTNQLPQTWHVANALAWPNELALRNLPDDYKTKMRDKLINWVPSVDKSRHDEIRGRLLQALDLDANCDISQVQHHLSTLDQLRGERLAAALPDLHSVIFQ